MFAHGIAARQRRNPATLAAAALGMLLLSIVPGRAAGDEHPPATRPSNVDPARPAAGPKEGDRPRPKARPMTGRIGKIEGAGLHLLLGDAGREVIVPVEPDTEVLVGSEKGTLADLEPNWVVIVFQEQGLTRSIQAHPPRGKPAAKASDRAAEKPHGDGDAVPATTRPAGPSLPEVAHADAGPGAQVASDAINGRAENLQRVGGQVATRDGKTFQGHTSWGDDGTVVVQPAGGEAHSFPLAEVVSARFDRPPTTRPSSAPTTVPTTGPSTRPAGWEEGDVGSAGGESAADAGLGGQVVVHDAGKGMRTGRGSESKWGADSLHLVYQRVDGDFEAVARVYVDVDTTIHNGVTSRAGLIARESLDPVGPYAMVARGAGGYSEAGWKTTLLGRADRGGGAEVIATSDVGIAGRTWVKLKRTGTRFEAFESVDGRDWKPVGLMDVAFTAKSPAYVGLASACGPGRESTFDRPQVSRIDNGRSDAAPAQAVVFRDGTVLAVEVVRVDEGQAAYRRQGEAREEEHTAAARNVARIVLRPLGGDLAAKVEYAPGPGLLLTTGDFIDGDFKGIADGRANISSLLFGLRSFDADRHVAAVVWARPDPAGGLTEVVLADGSRLVAKSIVATAGTLKVQTRGAGEFSVSTSDVVELRPVPPAQH